MAERWLRREAPDREAEAEFEYRIVLVRYVLRLALDPMRLPAEGRRVRARIEAADVAGLRELAVELNCAPALRALDQADELLAAEPGR